jgi:hypothetical protein
MNALIINGANILATQMRKGRMKRKLKTRKRKKGMLMMRNVGRIALTINNDFSMSIHPLEGR